MADTIIVNAATKLGKIGGLRMVGAAARDVQRPVVLCEGDNDPLGADAAWHWIGKPNR
jgi:hypothetical protein